MRALIAGEADVAMASRKITAQESEAAKAKGLQLDEHLIGYGGIVIITDQQNPVNELSIDQVRKIFTGEIVNWKDINGKDQAITVFKSGEKHPGTLLFVENDILGGVPITKSAITLPDFPVIIKKVAETAGSIAYARMRDPFPGPAARTKLLKIGKDEHSPSVIASRATIADGTYPLRRPYYLYTAAAAGKDVRSFVDFVVSKGWVEPESDSSVVVKSKQQFSCFRLYSNQQIRGSCSPRSMRTSGNRWLARRRTRIPRSGRCGGPTAPC